LNEPDQEFNIDLNRILVKPLYIGLLINIFFPAGILLIAYYIDRGGGMSSSMEPDTLNSLLWMLLVIAVADGSVAIMLKYKLFYQPMIKSKQSIEQDISDRVYKLSIICFAITTAIVIYGVVYFVLGGSFKNLMLFAFISFIAFQLIRPRHKFLEKVIAAQERYVAEGRFAEKS
jgi:hypothetical protein